MNQSPLWHFAILFFLSGCFFYCNAQHDGVQGIVVFSHNTFDQELLKKTFVQDILVEKISFESDVAFSQEEFLYLLGFGDRSLVSQVQIISALERFVKKNKFATIALKIIPVEAGVQLHFSFESEWTFKKTKIHKVYRGKHVFQQFYLMERGDIFDESKHVHAIVKINDFLTHSGYCNRHVSSNFEYDHRTKEVIVHIFIKRGPVFLCGSIDVEIIDEGGIGDTLQELSQLLRKKISHGLSSQPFTKDLLHTHRGILKDYLAKKGFLHSGIELEENIDYVRAIVDLKFKITIHQKRAIVFFGNHFFSKKELLEKVLAFGQSMWLLPASLLAEEIVREYKNKGFLHSKVSVQEEKERSFFVIQEGPRAVIKTVEIKNATIIGQSSVQDCFKKLLKHMHYDAQLYDEGISLLTQHYYQQGFLSFVVVSHEIIEVGPHSACRLKVIIDEGSRKYIATAFVEGYPEFDEQGPFKSSNFVDQDKVFDVKTIDQQRAWLVKHFQSLGYTNPRLKSVIESHDNTVSIKWIVDPGEKVHFGKTIIRGSSLFSFAHLEHFLFYKEGDVWDQEKVQRSFKALKDLEIFETIHFSADHSIIGEYKPILLKAYLDDRYEVRTRAGLELQHVRKYQTFSGLTYKVGGTAFIKNVTNCADQLRFDCDFARSHREIIGKYRRPWFTAHPFFTTVQVYSIMYDQPGFRVNSSVNNVYSIMQNGFLCGVQKKTQHFDVVWNNGCDWMKLHIKDDEVQLSFAQAIDFKPKLIDKMIPFFFTEPTIMFEKLDNPLYPTRGGVGLFSLKMMVPMADKYKNSFFCKALFEQSLFMSIKTVVAALRFRCGHIFYREFSGIMPSERFYLGGSHSLRGYEADLAPPLGVFVDDDGKQHVVPRGGRTMMNINVELRFPVWKKIGGVIFQDIGALSGTMFSDFRTQDLLGATGFGLRIFTPLGPLRFDIGWRWRKQLPIERSFAWFLTFGQAF